MSADKRVVLQAHGGVENLAVLDAPVPGPPVGDEVEVRVLHSCVSGADVNIRRNLYHRTFTPPFTPGYSIVGRVERCGPAATNVRQGDIVAALTVTGGHQTRVVLSERLLVKVPEGCDLRKAACLVLDYVTADQMLHRKARVSTGQRVFIHGASGAVGRALTELAQLEGLDIFGTASPRNADTLTSRGVTVFDYANHGWVDKVRAIGGVDAVFDPLGFDSFDRSYSILRRGGVLVGYGFNLRTLDGRSGSQNLSFLRLFARNAVFWRGRRAVFYGISRKDPNFAVDLTRLLGLLAAQSIDPAIKATFPIEHIAEAHTCWETGGGSGSIVIDV
jgi:NADPH:quinone reductase-like Zn-dependent oxidoreductase